MQEPPAALRDGGCRAGGFFVRILLLSVCVASWSCAARSVTIGVFADSTGADCRLRIPFPGNPVTVFVVAGSLDDLAPDGFVSSVFRIAGLPPGWSAQVLSTPGAAFAVGDALGSGVAIGYSTCIVGPSHVLMELAITPASSVQDVPLAIVPHDEDDGTCFNNRCGPCPRFCGCDFLPACYCADGIVSRINGPCEVVVEPESWSGWKSLFR